MQIAPFFAIFRARSMEFLRDKGAFLWNLIFPFVLIIAFVFLFGSPNSSVFRIGTVGDVPQEFTFLELQGIEVIDYSEFGLEKAIDRLRKHQISMLINFESQTYFINSEASNTVILRLLFTKTELIDGKTIQDYFALRESKINEKAVNYADWVVSGIIAMNMMFSCLFGVGFILIRYRKNGVLKRIKATPVTALTFLSAQVLSRFIIVFFSSVLIFLGTHIFFQYTIRGSILNLLLVQVIGILSMIALGLIFSARIKNEELGGNIINLVTWPMMLLSGIFFSLDNSPPIIQTIGRIFPLTHYIDSARAIMIDGAGLIEILPSILYLIIFTVVMLLVSSLLFTWD